MVVSFVCMNGEEPAVRLDDQSVLRFTHVVQTIVGVLLELKLGDYFAQIIFLVKHAILSSEGSLEGSLEGSRNSVFRVGKNRPDGRG